MRKKIKKTFRLISFLLSIIFLLLLLSSCSITLETSGANPEEAESIREIEQIIASAKLQYPTKNSEFFYNVYDTHVTITKYIGDGGDVVVPSQLNDLPVYVIDIEAFKGSSVTSVIIEEGIVKIKDKCFSGCESLQNVQLPESLFSLGEDAFSRCYSLKEIVFPKSISVIPYSVCYDCTSLQTVKILTESINSEIESMAFLRCTSLQNVYVTGSVSKISNNAFEEVSENVVFYGPAGCAAAEYCAKNFYEYSVIEEEMPIEIEEMTKGESQSDESSEHDGSKGGSIGVLIGILLILVGIIGGAIAIFIIHRRRP